MILVLEAIRHHDLPLPASLSARFDEAGGSIGRDESNDLVLRDDVYISRHHAYIRYENGGFIYTDSSRNGTLLCGKKRTLIKDSEPLADGDHLIIGGYELCVHIAANISTPTPCTPLRISWSSDFPVCFDDSSEFQGGIGAKLNTAIVGKAQQLIHLDYHRRQRSISSAIGFFEDKPEIYNHDSLAFHILRNARMRNEFMREVGALTSEEVAGLSLSQAKNRAAYARKLQAENKIFAVEFQGEQRYPAFQFDAQSGKPKPVIKQILEIAKDQWLAWQLALWFVTPNGYLDDQTPLEKLDAAPEAVLDTLRKEAGELEF